MRSQKDFDVWKKSMDLVDSIYKVTKSFPNDELYGLANQMRRAVISVPSNIAEGAARASKNEFVQFTKVNKRLNIFFKKERELMGDEL
jgi:four helix bundle protein